MLFTKGFGVPELVLILAIVVLVFGVGRLTHVGAVLGKAVRDFRNAVSRGDGGGGDGSSSGEPEDPDRQS